MKTPLDFCFKGDRDYVHGTDIVNKLMRHFAPYAPQNIDVKFNGSVANNLDLLEATAGSDAKVNIAVMLQGEAKKFQLVDNGQAIHCRYPYDESLIISNTRLDLAGQSIHLQQVTTFTFCENFVAMNKHLLQSIFPDEQGKWYFTRMELEHPIKDAALVSVKFIKNFNFRLTKSNLYIEDQCVGSVYFTMVR
jgi:hypothetical protein